jgi:hypothetical protein
MYSICNVIMIIICLFFTPLCKSEPILDNGSYPEPNTSGLFYCAPDPLRRELFAMDFFYFYFLILCT